MDHASTKIEGANKMERKSVALDKMAEVEMVEECKSPLKVRSPRSPQRVAGLRNACALVPRLSLAQ